MSKSDILRICVGILVGVGFVVALAAGGAEERRQECIENTFHMLVVGANVAASCAHASPEQIVKLAFPEGVPILKKSPIFGFHKEKPVLVSFDRDSRPKDSIVFFATAENMHVILVDEDGAEKDHKTIMEVKS